MPNAYFQFKQFTVWQDRCAMKVTTDGCLFGAWCAAEITCLHPKPANILDIGAGTGLLSLMVAQGSLTPIDAVEIEPAAAAQAVQNINSSPWADFIHIVEKDISAYTPATAYDCIISNPPFYENELASPQVDRNLAHHGSGLTLTHLLQNASRLLNNGGTFFLLWPSKRENEVLKQLAVSGWYVHQVTAVRQTPNHSPFRLMMKLQGHKTAEMSRNELLIRDAKGDYSAAFIHYIKDYYLAL